MERLIVKSATILFSNSTFYNKKADVLIEDGVIKKIDEPGKVKGKNVDIIDGKACFLAPGFFDLNCTCGEPGYVKRGDLGAGTAAAPAGGVPGLAVEPN